eukprot:g2413.t1
MFGPGQCVPDPEAPVSGLGLSFYRSPPTTKVWSWLEGGDIAGTWHWLDGKGRNGEGLTGQFYCSPATDEKTTIGLGCSTGPGFMRKVLPLRDDDKADPSSATLTVAQDLPLAFKCGAVLCPGRIYVRKSPRKFLLVEDWVADSSFPLSFVGPGTVSVAATSSKERIVRTKALPQHGERGELHFTIQIDTFTTGSDENERIIVGLAAEEESAHFDPAVSVGDTSFALFRSGSTVSAVDGRNKLSENANILGIGRAVKTVDLPDLRCDATTCMNIPSGYPNSGKRACCPMGAVRIGDGSVCRGGSQKTCALYGNDDALRCACGDHTEDHRMRITFSRNAAGYWTIWLGSEILHKFEHPYTGQMFFFLSCTPGQGYTASEISVEGVRGSDPEREMLPIPSFHAVAASSPTGSKWCPSAIGKLQTSVTLHATEDTWKFKAPKGYRQLGLTCAEGQYFERATNKCTSCPAGYMRDDAQSDDDTKCKIGTCPTNSYFETRPADKLEIKMWGAGGSSGDGNFAGKAAGGGSGAYATIQIPDAAFGRELAIIVGAGGEDPAEEIDEDSASHAFGGGARSAFGASGRSGMGGGFSGVFLLHPDATKGPSFDLGEESSPIAVVGGGGGGGTIGSSSCSAGGKGGAPNGGPGGTFQETCGKSVSGNEPSSAASDCQALYESGVRNSGLYYVNGFGNIDPPIQVFCDMERDGGGWTLISDYSTGVMCTSEDKGTAPNPPANTNYRIADEKIQALQGSGDGKFRWNYDFATNARPACSGSGDCEPQVFFKYQEGRPDRLFYSNRHHGHCGPGGCAGNIHWCSSHLAGPYYGGPGESCYNNGHNAGACGYTSHNGLDTYGTNNVHNGYCGSYLITCYVGGQYGGGGQGQIFVRADDRSGSSTKTDSSSSGTICGAFGGNEIAGGEGHRCGTIDGRVQCGSSEALEGVTRLVHLSFDSDSLYGSRPYQKSITSSNGIVVVPNGVGGKGGFATGMDLSQGKYIYYEDDRWSADTGGDRTFVIWYKGTQTGDTGKSHSCHVTFFGDPSNNVYIGLGLQAGKIALCNNRNSGQQVRGKTLLATGTWRMLVWSFSAATKCMTMYADGNNRRMQEEAVFCAPWNCYSGGYCMLPVIGGGYAYAGHVAPAAMDEAQIYSDALTLSQVQKIYDGYFSSGGNSGSKSRDARDGSHLKGGRGDGGGGGGGWYGGGGGSSNYPSGFASGGGGGGGGFFCEDDGDLASATVRAVNPSHPSIVQGNCACGLNGPESNQCRTAILSDDAQCPRYTCGGRPNIGEAAFSLHHSGYTGNTPRVEVGVVYNFTASVLVTALVIEQHSNGCPFPSSLGGSYKGTEGGAAPKKEDSHYVDGIAAGGSAGIIQRGGDGMVVVVEGGKVTKFSATGGAQFYSTGGFQGCLLCPSGWARAENDFVGSCKKLAENDEEIIPFIDCEGLDEPVCGSGDSDPNLLSPPRHASSGALFSSEVSSNSLCRIMVGRDACLSSVSERTTAEMEACSIFEGEPPKLKILSQSCGGSSGPGPSFGSRSNPAPDCAELLASGQTENGLYYVNGFGDIDPPVQVFCDMEMDGGGWTMVADYSSGSTIMCTSQNVGSPQSPPSKNGWRIDDGKIQALQGNGDGNFRWTLDYVTKEKPSCTGAGVCSHSNSNSGICLPCPAGKYENGNRCLVCKPCGPGLRRTGCQGFEEGSCESCGAGTFKASGTSATIIASSNTTVISSGKFWSVEITLPFSIFTEPALRGVIVTADGQHALPFSGGAVLPGDRFLLNGTSSIPVDRISDLTGGVAYSGMDSGKCSSCKPCDSPGQSRSGCGPASEGICVAWPRPVIIDATVGTALGTKLSTSGGTLITIIADFIGPAEGSSEIVLFYGSSSNSTKYRSGRCRVIVGDAGVSARGEDRHGEIECSSVPGVGHSLNLILTVAGAASLPFGGASISYAAPIVTSFQGAGAADDALTVGGEKLIIRGSNFGPLGTRVEATYRAASDTPGSCSRDVATPSQSEVYTASGCHVVSSHRVVACNTSEGAGILLDVKLRIAGLQSSSPTIGYYRPSVESVSPSVLNVDGTSSVLITGKNFGTGRKSDAVSVSFGPSTGREFAAIKCAIVTPHTQIRCNGTSSGIGNKHQWRVSVARQESPPSISTTAFGTPEIVAMSPENGVNPHDVITVIGRNLASPSERAVRVSMQCITSSGDAISIPLLRGNNASVVSFEAPVAYGAVACKILAQGEHQTAISKATSTFTYARPMISAVSFQRNGQGMVRLSVQAVPAGTYSGSSITAVVDVAATALVVVVGNIRSNVVLFDANRQPEIIPARGDVVATPEGSYRTMRNWETNGGTEICHVSVRNIDHLSKNGITVGFKGNPGQHRARIVNFTVDEIDPEIINLAFIVPPFVGRDVPLYITAGPLTSDLISAPLLLSSWPPVVTHVNDYVLPTRGARIILFGKHFGTTLDQVIIHLGEAQCGAMRRHNSTALSCLAQPGTGGDLPLKVSVGGQIFHSHKFFPQFSLRYAVPEMLQIKPLEGPTAGGFLLNISGNNFGARGHRVKIGDSDCNVQAGLSGHSLISCIVQPGVGADWPIFVMNDRQETSKGRVLRFSFSPPTLSVLHQPSRGLVVMGGEIITIRGKNFPPIPSLDVRVIFSFSFGETLVTPTNFVSAFEIRAEAPAGFDTGNVSVIVGGQRSVVPLQVHYAPPDVTLVQPYCGSQECFGVILPGGIYHEFSGDISEAFSTDGCSISPVRDSLMTVIGASDNWEDYASWQRRVSSASLRERDTLQLKRKCKAPQLLEVRGSNFGSDAVADISITVQNLASGERRDIPVSVRTDSLIRAPIPRGYGGGYELTVKIGRYLVMRRELGYQAPHVSSIQAASGQALVVGSEGTRIIFGGLNLFAETADDVKIWIGSSNVDGGMKACGSVEMIQHHPDNGLDGISCIPAPDTVGFKNISVNISGSIDDCSRNRLLCADPVAWPRQRQQRARSLVGGLDGLHADGPLFTCSEGDRKDQSYADAGEMCVSITDQSQDCGNQRCTYPNANPGFYRLNLDLEYESEDCGKLTKPGKCRFRRPQEAKRAMGFGFEPWSSDGDRYFSKDVICTRTCTDDSDCSGSDVCSVAKQSCGEEKHVCVSPELLPRCPRVRWKALIDPEKTYSEFPSLKPPKNCFDVVACKPKASCLGQNQCAKGYQYAFHGCMDYQKTHAVTNCTRDEECRTRSGAKKSSAGSASTSTCDPNHPEDCSFCKLGRLDQLTGERTGTCECMAGAPRCALCSLSAQGRKGYFRLDGECQECPDNPFVLMALFASAMLSMVGAGWIISKTKMNQAFLIIGMDYFQTIALFAGVKIGWPPWFKQVVRFFSIFNFNVDLTAPECVMPDFDYTIKWWATEILPILFAVCMFILWLSYLLYKLFTRVICCRQQGKGRRGGIQSRLMQHTSRVVAVLLIGFYCIYLSVTRRALDIFNCNPVSPDDGYLYTQFTSISCEGGLCRCWDTYERTQLDLVLPAAVALIVYTLGFPSFVFYTLTRNSYFIKEDQILRAYGLGEKRSGIGTDDRVYITRKRYHTLYYHFKPNRTYWMIMILARKGAIVCAQLLLRENTTFMLATVLLVLFSAFILQTKYDPYMSPSSYANVVKSLEAYAGQLQKVDANILADAEKTFLHMWHRVQKVVQQRRRRQTIERGRSNVQDNFLFASSIEGGSAKKNSTASYADFFYDYNTVEKVMLGSSILVSLGSIMYGSNEFDDGSLKGQVSRNAIAGGVAASILGAIIFYLVVFISEVTGKRCCSGRRAKATSVEELELSVIDDRQEDVEIMNVNPMNAGKHASKPLEKEGIRESEEMLKLLAENTELKKKIYGGETLKKIKVGATKPNPTLFAREFAARPAHVAKDAGKSAKQSRRKSVRRLSTVARGRLAKRKESAAV